MKRVISTLVVCLFLAACGWRLLNSPQHIGAWAAKVRAGYIAEVNR